MWQVRSATRPHGYRSWWAVLLLLPALVLSACSAGSETAPSERIADKGTPFADLLVPRVTASFADGAVGVPVDKPVTITASAGVLDSVVMTNESGTVVEGKLSSDGLTWETAEPLGFNKTYTVNARSLGLGGVTNRQLTFETPSPDNQTMP